jgi:hypothetical protein
MIGLKHIGQLTWILMERLVRAAHRLHPVLRVPAVLRGAAGTRSSLSGRRMLRRYRGGIPVSRLKQYPSSLGKFFGRAS